MEKNLKIKPIDLSFKGKYRAYCPELPFGISFSRLVNIETMNIISFDVEINEYENLGVQPEKLVNALKELCLQHFLGFFKQLIEGKSKSDTIYILTW